ncbi:Nuclear transport factor 2 [Lunasporangiospora selenospora]|uniref:Nuclear transport factor 2 n=1 Tax=Lunasporangiospora selenospora TaxID=979761 RepID=A0A9P6FSK2_9FUNG|nr:Nuclear transport factor 2 [Lunasporangiospora selenospora]
MSAREIAEQFVKFYYQTFDTNRAGLAHLYRDTSMMSFESAETMSAVAIVEKLVSLPFSKVEHKILSVDAQPVDANILILVSGQLLTDGESHPQFFSQSFLLKNDGNFYIAHDIFRLIYG